MADIDLKTETPDTTLPTTGFLFGADSQAAASPSVFTVQSVATTLLGSTTLTGATITADAPVLNMSQTWNNGAVTFTGLKFNVASDTSAAASLLMDLQVGGTPQVRVSKAGRCTVNDITLWSNETPGGTSTKALWAGPNSTVQIGRNGSAYVFVTGNGFGFPIANTLGWGYNNSGGSADLEIGRRAAANLRFGAADAAGSAISVSSVASNQLTLASNHGLSNGAAVQVTFTAGGAVPAGTAVNTTYYARSISAAVLELYGTYDQAITTASTTGRVAVTTAGTTAFVNRATPYQTLSVQSFTGTDIPGQPLVITGSQGTGTGAGGSIIFQVAPAGSSGTAQNALATALTIQSNGRVELLLGGIEVNNTTNSPFSIQGTAVIRRAGNVLNLLEGASYWQELGFYANNVKQASAIPSGFSIGNSNDTILARDTSNTLAQRNGNNGQIFRLYGRFTDITNDFERFFINAPTNSGDAVQLGTQKGATAGTARALELQTDGTTRLTISATTSTITLPDSSTLNTGTGGVVRLRYINDPSNLISFFDFYNTAGLATFALGATNGRMNFGGTTSSFPALKRSSASLIVRLADDTANAALESASLKTDAPTGGTAATWKLGTVASVTPTLQNRTIEVDIGGTIYYISAKTTND